MQLQSSAFQNQQMIPIKYTCKGNNINPPFTFFDVPQGTKSLALVTYDPDSPSGDFVHWLMWNIPPQTTGVQDGQVPTGVTQGVNDFGNPAYGGPCPHGGTHRYVFSLFALDDTLDLPQQTSRPQLLEKLKGHTLASATLTGLFSADNR